MSEESKPMGSDEILSPVIEYG